MTQTDLSPSLTQQGVEPKLAPPMTAKQSHSLLVLNEEQFGSPTKVQFWATTE